MSRYSDTVMDHFTSPRNWGLLQSANRIGVAGIPGQGRYLVLYLQIRQEQVVDVGFRCHGCGGTIAAGSALTEMILGKPMAECRQLSAADLLDALDGLPPDKLHCAGFAIQALQNALRDEGSDE